jgi:3-oxoacyl-[acyl-carrier protein] reductase
MGDSSDISGEVAIVTGAAQGIGRGIARVLAEAGVKIVIGDIQPADRTVSEIKDMGGEAVSMVMDTSNPREADALVDLALDQFGRLDILVNNAGIDAPRGNAWDLPDEEWRRTIDVNVNGVFYCSRAALKPMMEAGKGFIVNMSSQSARVGEPGMSPAYNASKAALLGMTMEFALQVADKGIRVVALMPGAIDSREPGWSEERKAELLFEYPLGVGTPGDIGEMVRHLASPAAKWVSGTAIQLTGGYQRGKGWF